MKAYSKIENITKLKLFSLYPGYPSYQDYLYTVKEEFLLEQYKKVGPQIFMGEDYENEYGDEEDDIVLRIWANGRYICFGGLYEKCLTKEAKEEILRNIELVEKIGLFNAS